MNKSISNENKIKIYKAYQQHRKLKHENLKETFDEILTLSNIITLEDLKKEIEIIKKSIKKNISDEGILSILLKILQKNKEIK